MVGCTEYANLIAVILGKGSRDLGVSMDMFYISHVVGALLSPTLTDQLLFSLQLLFL
jgi:hypothetical protein